MNTLSVARFHTDDYRGALDGFLEGLERQGPYGPAMIIYHAASLAALGKKRVELEILKRYKSLNSGVGAYSVEGWLRRANQNENYIAPLLAEIEKIKNLK